MKPKKLLLLSVIDTVFVSLSFLFLVFILNKIRSYFTLIQEFGNTLQGINTVVQNNLSQADVNVLATSLDSIGKLSGKITLLGVGAFVVLFLLYCIVQSIQWSIVFDSFRNYKKYLLKFIGVSFGYAIFLAFMCYLLLIQLKDFIENFWFGKFFKSEVFIYILFLFLIATAVTYIIILAYIYLRDNSITEASSLALKNSYKEYKLFILFVLLAVVCISLAFIWFRIFGQGLVLNLVLVFILMLILNWYRIHISEKIK